MFAKIEIHNSFLKLQDYYRHLNYLLGLTKGLPVYIWMNKKGLVLSVEGFNEIADSVAVLSKENKKEIRYCLSDYIGEKTIKDNLNPLFSIVSNRAQKAGDSWVNNITLINKAPVKLSSMYTVKQIKNDSIWLVLSTIVSARAAEGANPFMEGRQTGEIVVAYSTGIPYFYHSSGETKSTTNLYEVFTTEVLSGTIR